MERGGGEDPFSLSLSQSLGIMVWKITFPLGIAVCCDLGLESVGGQANESAKSTLCCYTNIKH